MGKRSQTPAEVAAASGPDFPRHKWLELPAPSPWQAAEARLYPLIMSDPDLYEAAVTLMAEARDVLRAECDTASAVAEKGTAAVLACCPSALRTLARGVDAETVVDAARAQRSRELATFQATDAPHGSNREGH